MVVIEQPDEVDRIIEASKSLGAAPYIGVRAKLSSRSTGRWGSSVGDKAKFGLSIPELLATVERLRENNLLPDLRLLHFHIGSQINDIAVLKDALQEAGQIYVELTRLGAPMGFLDVGGGLGIDYDGSRTASAASTNYSLQNYANDVVATVRECCEPNGVAVPTLVSESGRAIASHFSLLVFDVLGSSALPASIPNASGDEPLTVRNLRDTLATIQELSATADAQLVRLQEAWNDALKFKQDALAAFRLGLHGAARPRHSRTTDVGLRRCHRPNGFPRIKPSLKSSQPSAKPWRERITPTCRSSAQHPTPGPSISCFRWCPSSSWINGQPDWPTSPTSPAIPMGAWIASSEMDNPNSCWSCTSSTTTTPI